MCGGVWRDMGAHEGGTHLVRAIVYIFVKEMDTERKQIFTEPLETLVETHTASLYISPGMGDMSMDRWDVWGLWFWLPINLP